MESATAYFFCTLCGEEKTTEDVALLDSCTCLFCRACIASYVANQLNDLTGVFTGLSFLEHFRPRRSGTYIDNEGRVHGATVTHALLNSSWEDSEVTLKLDDGTHVLAPFWRVSVTTASELPSFYSFTGIACPGIDCSGNITKAEAMELCPAQFDIYTEAESTLNAFLSGCVRCPYPNCRAMIERLFPEKAEGALEGEEHGQHYRFRCAACQRDFCGVCFDRPYHAGYNCREARLPNCRFCQEKLMATVSNPQDHGRHSATYLKRVIDQNGLDRSWCLEKSDLLWVMGRTKSVCPKSDCRAWLRKSCTKRLPCGHACCGVRNDTSAPGYVHSCLSCFEVDCPHSSAEFDGCQICRESFTSSPCIELPCKHLIHLECARERVRQGYPGPSISFNHLYCSMCGTAGVAHSGVDRATANPPFNHPLLKNEMQSILELRKTVTTAARRRLRQTGDIKAEELQPGGAFEGRPVDFALKKYMYYLCHQCKQPYFGGLRDCQVEAQNAGTYDPKDLMCGSCCAIAAGQNCQQHGTTYIEWKCRYCCNVACWFCWGTTHFCDPCHQVLNKQKKPCPGGNCPLKIQHPPPGTEFCLGCALCRHRDE